jgi:diadenosine tetraphosphatase ApaH/serine/threonine PP2A family protein phosphatase
VRSDVAQIETYASIAASFAWTRGFVSATGWFDWLAALPLEIRATAHGVRLLAVHAAPGTDDGVGIHPGQGNAELAAILDGCDADIVMVGHTHEAMLRRVGPMTLINLGSVGNPRSGDLRASYVILDFTDDDVTVEHRRVDYDREAFAVQVRASHNPATTFILAHQRGEVLARQRHADHAEPVPGVRVSLR